MVGKTVFQCSPCKMFAVVGCTPGLSMHQGLFCHVLAWEHVALCLSFPKGRVGCDTSMHDGETPAAVGLCCSRHF